MAVILGIEVLGTEALVDKPEDAALKLNLKCKDWEGVEGPVLAVLFLMWTDESYRNAYLNCHLLKAKEQPYRGS